MHEDGSKHTYAYSTVLGGSLEKRNDNLKATISSAASAGDATFSPYAMRIADALDTNHHAT